MLAQAVPPLFAPYRHEDIDASFAPVLQYLGGVLNREEGSAFNGFPFRFDRDLFSLLFAPEWAGQRLLLAVRSQREDETSSRAWIDAALIGSHPLQKSMRDRRILGASRTFTAAEHGLMTQKFPEEAGDASEGGLLAGEAGQARGALLGLLERAKPAAHRISAGRKVLPYTARRSM